MNDQNHLRELYQELILDHYRQPRNCHPLPDANREAEGFNPLCGDRLKLHLKVEDGVIRGISFEGSGCAISTASASLMTEALQGKSEQQAEALFRALQGLLTQQAAIPALADPAGAGLGKLAALLGVREFPARIKCATLAWHTLHAALNRQAATVSTE